MPLCWWIILLWSMCRNINWQYTDQNSTSQHVDTIWSFDRLLRKKHAGKLLFSQWLHSISCSCRPCVLIVVGPDVKIQYPGLKGSFIHLACEDGVICLARWPNENKWTTFSIPGVSISCVPWLIQWFLILTSRSLLYPVMYWNSVGGTTEHSRRHRR